MKLDPGIELAPIAHIVIDDQLMIQAANQEARHWRMLAGTNLSLFLPIDDITSLKANIAGAVDPFELDLRIRNESMEKPVQVKGIPGEGTCCLWFFDLSEVSALSHQIRRLKQPVSRVLRQVNHLAATGLAYSEFVDVMVTDNQVLSPEKLSIAAEYQREILEAFRHIQALVAADPKTSPPSIDKSSRASILVVDQHRERTEVISELLKSRGYRVVSFHDAQSALEYCGINGNQVATAIIDEELGAGSQLLQRLGEISARINIVTLVTGDKNTSEESVAASFAIESETKVTKPIDFEELLKAIDRRH